MISGRQFARDDIGRIWDIDRREVIDAMYHLEQGVLVLRPFHVDVAGWPPGQAEKYTPLLEACFDRGGWLHGLFDDDHLIGVGVLDGRFIGRAADMLQLEFLHVDRGYRGRGLGQRLFALAAREAAQRGARKLYVSATPSQHTIDFYLRLGCVVTPDPDAELLALEPEDIHLEYALVSRPIATGRSLPQETRSSDRSHLWERPPGRDPAGPDSTK